MTKTNVYDIFGCDVLSANLQYIREFNLNLLNIMGHQEADLTKLDLSGIMDSDVELDSDLFLQRLEACPIYNSSLDEISQKFKFPNTHIQLCKLMLNTAAHKYLTEVMRKHQKIMLPGFEKEIEKLQMAAERFSYALKPFLDWDPSIDVIFDQYPVYSIFKRLNTDIDELKSLKHKLRTSTIGMTAELGSKKPFGNSGLYEFIDFLSLFWHDVLNRTLIQKYDGLNGRKQFLEFLMDCLQPVHPTLEHSTVDSALKKYQKSMEPRA